MNGFSNLPIKDALCGGCNCTGFAPSVAFVYDPTAHTIVFTDNSTYPSADSRKIVQLYVKDDNAKIITGSIASGATTATLDVSTLDASQGFILLVTVISASGCLSDGEAYKVGVSVNAGNIGKWDKDYDAINVAAAV